MTAHSPIPKGQGDALPDEPQTDPKARRSQFRLVLEDVPPARSWKKRFLFFALWSGLVGATAALMGVLGLYYKFSQNLPDIPKVDEYWPPIVTEVFTDDAVLAGEFYNERRKVV